MQDGDEGYKSSALRSPASVTQSKNGDGDGDGDKEDSSYTLRRQRQDREKEEARRERARIMMEEAWRKDGRERRRMLLEEDEMNGGSDFHINHDCSLRNYGAIADRVSRYR